METSNHFVQLCSNSSRDDSHQVPSCCIVHRHYQNCWHKVHFAQWGKLRRTPNRPTTDKLESDIRLIFKNSKIIIPYISKSWNELRKIIREIDAIHYFTWITDNYPPVSKPIQADGIRELITTERTMGEANRLVIHREATTGFKVLDKLLKKAEYPEKNSSVAYNKFLFLSILSGFYVENKEELLKSMKGTGFSLDFEVEMIISNIVCFEFFTYLTDGVRLKKIGGYGVNTTRDEELFAVKKWNKFQKNNREFRLWYTAWIEEIKKFEERNLHILKQRNFLRV